LRIYWYETSTAGAGDTLGTGALPNIEEIDQIIPALLHNYFVEGHCLRLCWYVSSRLGEEVMFPNIILDAF
jgi:hypothetical protein